jgi:uncharacterized protein (DUF169 family)
MQEKKLEKFKKSLKIREPILGVFFVDKLPSDGVSYHKDTVCTAMIRAFFKKESVFFNATDKRQLCEGADFFFNFAKISKKKICNVYVKEEGIFENDKVCKKFLKSLPKLPTQKKYKNIIIKPFLSKDRPEVVLLLVNPVQAGRILGLLNHSDFNEIRIIPNQPTCISIFAPLVNNQPHINFIDYFDRHYQGVIGGKKYFRKENLTLSFKVKQFETILSNLDKSSQGTQAPLTNPKKVDRI